LPRQDARSSHISGLNDSFNPVSLDPHFGLLCIISDTTIRHQWDKGSTHQGIRTVADAATRREGPAFQGFI
jgi:hypothetical protein